MSRFISFLLQISNFNTFRKIASTFLTALLFLAGGYALLFRNKDIKSFSFINKDEEEE